jgi:protocatechuate 3,4-dioxygenase beta subunit
MRLWSRRGFLGLGLALPFGAVGWQRASTPPLPASLFDGVKPCDPNEKLTPAVPAGADYRPRSPQRTSLIEAGVTGTALVLAGQVAGIRCGVVKGAVLDFWQADARGHYDAAGFRLRGRQTTDAQGRYRLETIVPGPAGVHARCLHVIVQAPKAPALPTALFFPDDPRNAKEPGFHAELLIKIAAAPANGKTGTFDFILDL